MIGKSLEGKKVIVQFSTAPVGNKVSISRFVSAALKEVDNSGLRYQLTPMSTVLEADTLREAVEVIFKAHEAVFQAGANRVVTDIKIDDRSDTPRRMEDKVEKVRRLLDNSTP